MRYVKERNFIVAYDENDNLRGKWDIIHNSYMGVRGQPIKSAPAAFKCERQNEMPDYISHVFQLIAMNNQRFNPYTIEVGMRLEQIISLGLIVKPDYSTWDFLHEDTTSLNKDVVQFLNAYYDGVYNSVAIANYQFGQKYNTLLNKCGEQRLWALDALRQLDKHSQEIPQFFIEGMILRGIHEKVFEEYSYGSYARLVLDWYSMITLLGDTLEVKHNIISNYVILKYIYRQYKNSHYDDVLDKNNNLPWLYYENDEYIVRPLCTRKEFHEEATHQQNCVERLYMEAVYNGNTHVVVVRKKSRPERSYITCEVTNDGKIWQYLYRFNRQANNPADVEFRAEYSAHLRSSLSK